MKLFKFFLFVISALLAACSSKPVPDLEPQTTTPMEVVEPSVEVERVPNKNELEPKPSQPVIDKAVQAPPAVIALLTRADKQLRAGELAATEATIQRAIRIAPRFPESYYRLALLRYQQKKYNQARALSEKCLSLGALGELYKQARELIESIAE